MGAACPLSRQRIQYELWRDGRAELPGLTFAQWHWWCIDRERDAARVESNLVKFLKGLPAPVVKIVNR